MVNNVQRLRNSRVSVSTKLKKYLFAGIATVLPVFLTLYLALIIFRLADNLAGKYINSFLLQHYGFRIPGLGLVILIIVIIIAGVISTRVIGKKLLPLFEKLILKIPFIASIYPSVKKLSDFFFEAEAKSKYKKVVLVQYPTDWSYAIGFITNESLNKLNQKVGETLVCVFVPLAPTPFSGILLLLPLAKIKILDMSIEQAIKFIISGGVIAPEEIL